MNHKNFDRKVNQQTRKRLEQREPLSAVFAVEGFGEFTRQAYLCSRYTACQSVIGLPITQLANLFILDLLHNSEYNCS